MRCIPPTYATECLLIVDKKVMMGNDKSKSPFYSNRLEEYSQQYMYVAWPKGLKNAIAIFLQVTLGSAIIIGTDTTTQVEIEIPRPWFSNRVV